MYQVMFVYTAYILGTSVATTSQLVTFKTWQEAEDVILQTQSHFVEAKHCFINFIRMYAVP